MNVVGEMSTIVEECELLDVSALEQDLACNSGHDTALGVCSYSITLTRLYPLL